MSCWSGSRPRPPSWSRIVPLPGAPGATAAGQQDWSATPLGPATGWPQSLKTAASMVLGSTVPMFLAWGPDMLLIYNDSYADILGDRTFAIDFRVRRTF